MKFNNKNTLRFGISCFVLSGLFSAVVSGRIDEVQSQQDTSPHSSIQIHSPQSSNEQDTSPHTSIQIQESSQYSSEQDTIQQGTSPQSTSQQGSIGFGDIYRGPPLKYDPLSELSMSSYQIRTFADVAKQTFFEKRTKSRNNGLSYNDLDARLQSKIKEIEQTYAGYFEKHLYFLHVLNEKLIPVDIYRSMGDAYCHSLSTDYVYQARDLITKCRDSLAINGIQQPDWLDRCADLLNRMKIIHHVGDDKVEIAVHSLYELTELRKTLQGVFVEDFERLPKIKYSDILADKGYNERVFGERWLPWMKFISPISYVMKYYKKYDCTDWFGYYHLLIESELELNLCLSIIHHYQLNQNLMNLHIVLDMNSKVLPYSEAPPKMRRSEIDTSVPFRYAKEVEPDVEE